jgi:c-di-GMP-binding flagellar brake protein YcgR
MDLKDFTVNGHIEIWDDNIAYISIIQDKDEASITINIPYSGNKYYTIHPNMKLCFTRTDTTCIYKYYGTVTESRLERFIQLFRICDICFIEKIQRRNYYRHAIALPLDYCIIPENMYSLNIPQLISCLDGSMMHSVTRDISGGGLCIVLKKPCSINDKLIVSFAVGKRHIYAKCSIVRLGKDKETAIDVAGLEFIDINENNRDKIIQFIFQKLVANRKLFR